VSLRVRLAIAFAAILLGPVALLALLVDHAVAPAPTADRTDQAAAAVRVRMAAECARLNAQARSLAVVAVARPDSYAVMPAGTIGEWAVCGEAPGRARYTVLAARFPVGSGWAYAVRPVDAAFLSDLSAAAGVPVTLSDTAAPGLGPLPLALGKPAHTDTGSGWPVALAAAVAAVVMATVLGTWLAGLATRPLRHLVATVDRVTAGDLTARSRIAGRDEVGRIAGGLDRLVGTMRETQHLAVTDALTGLGNIRHLADALRIEIERATRFRRAVGVLLLDLDHFKEVNDSYGHRAGDAVLAEFARRIRGVVREVDLAFRQGGEEFVILLPETDVAGSLTAARRLGDAVRAEPFAVADLRISVTVSIGVAVFPRHAGTGVQTLEAADAALYAAKAAGRDTFVLANGSVPAPRAEPRPATPAGVAGGASVRTPCTQITTDG
jgi:diguanylate cyclase (GGDEF)-like protein